MKKAKLSSNEIQDLIHRYKSELKKLEFQVSDIDHTISQLEALRKRASVAKKAKKIKIKKIKPAAIKIVTPEKKRKRGRPAKQAIKVALTPKASKVVKDTKPAKTHPERSIAKVKKSLVKIKKISKPKKHGTVRKIEAKKGYRLTFWDQYVIDSIKQAGKVRITQEIVNYVGSKLKSEGKTSDEKEIQNKVIRSLQKLANRRNDLKKVPFEGKGLAYALPAWIADNGKLYKEYKR